MLEKQDLPMAKKDLLVKMVNLASPVKTVKTVKTAKMVKMVKMVKTVNLEHPVKTAKTASTAGTSMEMESRIQRKTSMAMEWLMSRTAGEMMRTLVEVQWPQVGYTSVTSRSTIPTKQPIFVSITTPFMGTST